MQLGWLAERYPRQLSGGQRQRVALARALAIEPRVLLLDEPFGALDAKVRKELRRWLRNLHNEIHVTSIFVTHDQEEALEVADRVVVMDKGRIEQAGTPQQVYDHPQTPAVHEFIGESIVVPVTVEAGDVRFGGEPLGLDPQGLASGAALLFARPHDVTIVPTSGEHRLKGVVRRIHGIGPARRVEVALGERDGRDADRGRCTALAATAHRATGRVAAGSVPAVSIGTLTGARSVCGPIRRIGMGRAGPLCPGRSDVDLFYYRKAIIDLNAKVSHGALDLGVAKQQLHGAQVTSPPIDQSSLGSSEGVGAEQMGVQANAGDPLSHKPGVLPCRHAGARAAAGKQEDAAGFARSFMITLLSY